MRDRSGFGPAGRLAAKEMQWAIVARIADELEIPPCLAKAHYDDVARYFVEAGHAPAKPGQLSFSAVAAEEPAGKPLADCRKVQVVLDLAAEEDLEALSSMGLRGMRQSRLARVTGQAQEQGGLLTIEDLAFLLCSSPATVKRDLKELRRRGHAAPTRGQIKEIGAGVTHQAEAVRLYLSGASLDDVRERTGYSHASIRRYLRDFRNTVALRSRGCTLSQIRATTGRPAELISQYLRIQERGRGT